MVYSRNPETSAPCAALEAIRILNDESPWVWLFNRQNLIAVNTSRLTTGDSLAWGPGHLMYMNHPYDWTVQE